MSSIPRGVGAPPPPGMESGGKLMCIKVRLLDDTVAVFHLGHRAVGQTLFDEVCRHLNLLENDYFGLEFIDNDGCHIWLDMEKQILRQISSTTDAKFHLIVKFYTPNPVDLEEEYTRYLFSLQLRRDLSQGHFICAENTSALLCAYLVQAECGDFSTEDYPDPGYLSHTRFIPNQTIHFQQKVMDNHRKLIGLSPEESDLQMLEVARRCDFYGIKFHLAKDVEGTDACLAVTHLGVKVFHQLHCVSTFSWAKIRKLSFKRKKLLIKLHPDSYQYYKETIEFVFESRNECKTFWKKCVEHHAFFRCPTMEAPKKDHRFFTKGSSFRYHGRTQKQLIDYVREHHKRREPFTRPLRSGYHTASAGCSSSGYSAVVRREKSASSSQHAQSGTLDARRPRNNGWHEHDGGAVSDAEGVTGGHRRRQPTERPPATAQEMSLSLPNVSDDLQVVAMQTAEPPKSQSGDNFLEMNMRKEFDNVSQDSYKLSDHERSKHDHAGDGNQIYDTRFTSKQIGNVTVTRVLSSSEEAEKAQPSSSHSLPTRKKLKEFPCYSTNLVPIEIDGPNVSIESKTTVGPSSSVTVQHQPMTTSLQYSQQPIYQNTSPIYTSSGALLLKPKVIDSVESKDQPTSSSYGTISARVVCKPIVSPETSVASASNGVAAPEPDKRSTSPQTYGAIGPLPGRVLTKENLMITPDGIKEKKIKPSVPPKPKNVVVGQPQQQNEYAEVVRDEDKRPSGHPVVNMAEQLVPQTPESERKKLVPFEADVVTSVGAGAQATSPPPPPPPPPPHQGQERRPLNKPSLISVKSEDSPDIEKCHLFNSDIPYTLTVRKVSESSQPFSTFKSDSPRGVELSTNSLERKSITTSQESLLRRKSLDLVPRNRLPSPGNFSSTDHTISPTTPDSGDVLEYLLRRRSMSQERSALAKKGRRGDPRRMTQPVRFDLPEVVDDDLATSGSTPSLSIQRSTSDTQKRDRIRPQSMGETQTDRDDDDLPPPPPQIQKKSTKTPPPPPPKPKGVSEKVQQIKITSSVTSATTVNHPAAAESTFGTREHATVVLNVSSEKIKETAEPETQTENGIQEEKKLSSSDSPPYIDESPKHIDDRQPTSRRDDAGVLWTDF